MDQDHCYASSVQDVPPHWILHHLQAEGIPPEEEQGCSTLDGKYKYEFKHKDKILGNV